MGTFQPGIEIWNLDVPTETMDSGLGSGCGLGSGLVLVLGLGLEIPYAPNRDQTYYAFLTRTKICE